MNLFKRFTSLALSLLLLFTILPSLAAWGQDNKTVRFQMKTTDYGKPTAQSFFIMEYKQGMIGEWEFLPVAMSSDGLTNMYVEFNIRSGYHYKLIYRTRPSSGHHMFLAEFNYDSKWNITSTSAGLTATTDGEKLNLTVTTMKSGHLDSGFTQKAFSIRPMLYGNDNISAAHFMYYDQNGYPLTYTINGSGQYCIAYFPRHSTAADAYYTYVIQVPGFKKATGKFYYNKTSPANEQFVAEENNLVEFDTHETINLVSNVCTVTFKDVKTGTSIELIQAPDGVTMSQGIGSVLSAIFDLDELDEATIDILVKHDDFKDIPLTLKITKTAMGFSVKLLNTDMDAYTYEFDYNENAAEFVITQLPEFIPQVYTDNKFYSKNLSFYQFINGIRQYAPGHNNYFDFEITNNSSRPLRLVDYSFADQARGLGDLLRVNSTLHQEMTAYYELTQTGMDGLYNFETLYAAQKGASLTYYDAMLDYLNHKYAVSYEKIEDFDADIIAEIFNGNFTFENKTLVNEPTQGNLVRFNTSFMVLEKDEKMIELAKHLLYDHSLSVTFDALQYDVIRSDMPDPDSAVLLPSYVNKTQNNQDMVYGILSRIPDLKPGESYRLTGAAFALNGTLIHNAFRGPGLGTEYYFDFDMTFIFEELAVFGIAFVDENNDGEYQEGERLLPGLKAELIDTSTNETVATTYTGEDGYYIFGNVADGQYKVRIEIPEDMKIGLYKDTTQGNKFLSTGTTAAFEVQFDTSLQLNAGFVVNEGQDNVKIIYDAAGGKGSVIDPASPYPAGSEVTVLTHDYKIQPSTGFTRDNYVFTGWNTMADGNGTAYLPGDTLILTEDTVLYAQWKPAPPDTNTGLSPMVMVWLMTFTLTASILLLARRAARKQTC